jgi:hypothetical protein
MPVPSRSARAAARNAAALALQNRRNQAAFEESGSADLPEGYAEQARESRQQAQARAADRKAGQGKTLRPGSHRVLPSSSQALKQGQEEYAAKAKAAREQANEDAKKPKATQLPAKKPLGRPKKK